MQSGMKCQGIGEIIQPVPAAPSQIYTVAPDRSGLIPIRGRPLLVRSDPREPNNRHSPYPVLAMAPATARQSPLEISHAELRRLILAAKGINVSIRTMIP